jgi:hypothetical protein
MYFSMAEAPSSLNSADLRTGWQLKSFVQKHNQSEACTVVSPDFLKEEFMNMIVTTYIEDMFLPIKCSFKSGEPSEWL